MMQKMAENVVKNTVKNEINKAIGSNERKKSKEKDEYSEHSDDIVTKGTRKALQSSSKCTSTTDALSSTEKEQATVMELRFRFYEIKQIPSNLREVLDDLKKAEPSKMKVAVEVKMDKEMLSTTFVSLKNNTAYINEGVNLSTIWPPESDKIFFRFLVTDKDKKVELSTTFLSIPEICCNYSKQPAFGPALVNFYTYDNTSFRKKWSNKDKKKITSGSIPGTRFIGKLMVEIECEEGIKSKPMLYPLNSSSIGRANNFYKFERYVFFSTFMCANHIPPDYKTKDIKFVASLGEFGNEDFDQFTIPSSNQTIKILPIHDGRSHYAIYWGNRKPVAGAICLFEDFSHRFGSINALLNLARYIETLTNKCMSRPELTKPEDESYKNLVSSLSFEILEYLEDKIEAIFCMINALPEQVILTDLDRSLRDERLKILTAIKADVISLKESPIDIAHADEFLINRFGFYAEKIKSVAYNPQASLPEILIRMIVDKEAIGFARIPIVEAFYLPHTDIRDHRCGKVRHVYMKWTKRSLVKEFGEQIPCVLQLRLWVSLMRDYKKFEKLIIPGRLSYRIETFYNQKRLKNEDTFVAYTRKSEEEMKDSYMSFDVFNSVDPVAEVTDETGAIYLNANNIGIDPDLWKSNMIKMGSNEERSVKLKQCRIHDLWSSLSSFDEIYEMYEVEELHIFNKLHSWRLYKYTNKYGESMKNINEPPRGWNFIEGEGWAVDFHKRGDSNGWLYSISSKFYPPDSLSEILAPSHRYRRRRLTRQIRLISNINAEKNLEVWEYADNYDKPLRTERHDKDKFRRKIKYLEIEPIDGAKLCDFKAVLAEKPSEYKSWDEKCPGYYVTPRIYELHKNMSKFKLCLYLVWARELPTPYQVSTPFVRAFFMDQAMTSKKVDTGNTASPVWNETLIFEDKYISGSYHQSTHHPSEVLLEVVDQVNGIEIILGRCHIIPKFCVKDAEDTSRSTPEWHSLEFNNAAYTKRGAIFASADLFRVDEIDLKDKPLIPDELMEKRESYECPKWLRSKLAPTRYSIQFVAWGLRDCQSGIFKSLRKPFIEVLAADKRIRSESLVSIRKNPNFARPLLVFDEAIMPTNLAGSPPIIVNLYEISRFSGVKLIGNCIIRNLRRFQRTSNPLMYSDGAMRINEAYNVRMVDERTQLRNLMRNSNSNAQEPDLYDIESLPLDWWSKYNPDKHYKNEYGILQKFNFALEEIREYGNFEDFLETFYFYKPDLDIAYRRKSIQALAKAFFQKIFSRSKRIADIEEGWSPQREDFRGSVKGQIHIFPYVQENIPNLRHAGVVSCLVRVYVVRAWKLSSDRSNQSCDSYVKISCGNKRPDVKFRKLYVARSVNPVYGQLFEMYIKIPQQKDLTITVMDNHRIRSDREIGSTTIDLENRLLTRYRATVGLPTVFRVQHPFEWRDQHFPLELLKNYCDIIKLPPPMILTNEMDVGLRVLGIEVWARDVDPEYWVYVMSRNKEYRDPNINFPLQRVALFILRHCGLVPEHVETRTLYHSKRPYVEAGGLELFVDLFPLQDGPIPPPIDISPRRPRSFQLRLVVWKTKDVMLSKKSFGHPAGDIYLKCYFNGASKRERTDIHYRCLDGAASFNWRFLLDFDYDPWERQLVAYSKDRIFRKKTSRLVDPILCIELWDNNKFGREGLIGECHLNLLTFEVGLFDEDQSLPHIKYEKEPGCCRRTFSFCRETYCCIRPRKRLEVRMPKAPLYLPEKVVTFNLFKQRESKGWWPCIIKGAPNKKRNDPAVYKKDDYYDPEAFYVTGFVEMEMSLLSKDEAEKHPVGKKRNKPNHSPYLPKPDRPTWDSYWCTSRIRPCMSFCWRRCGWQFFVLVLLIGLAALLIASFVYQAPHIAAEELINLEI